MNFTKDRNKKLLIGTIIYAIGNFGTKIISFLIVPLYTFYIEPSDMGNYDLITTTVSLLTPVITLRISDAAYRWILKNPNDTREYIASTYQIVFMGTVLSAGIIAIINIFFPILYCYYFIALLFFGRWLESLQTLLRGLKKRTLFAISGIIYTLVYVLLNLYFVIVLQRGVVSLFESAVISSCLVIIFILIFTPELRTCFFKCNKKLTSKMLKYSAPLVPSGLSWWVMGASDRYVIRLFIGSAATGIYSIANKFPSIITMVFALFGNSFSDLIIGDFREKQETSEYTSKLFKRLYVFSFSFLLILIPATKYICSNILNESYIVGGQYVGFLYLGASFQGFTSIISVTFLQSKEGSRYIAHSSIVGAIVNICFDIIAINIIGIHAASISTFLGFFIMWILRMHDSKKVVKINIDIWNFAIWFLPALLMAMITIFTDYKIDFWLSICCGPIFLIANIRVLINFIRKKLN